MGLKCSLLGHAYEPADVERDREEQGSEVVTVVRELERCRRCGAERVVSESTEVTAVVEPEDVGLDETTPAGDASEADTETTGDGAFDGIVERSGALADDEEPSESRAESTAIDDDDEHGMDESEAGSDVDASEPETPRSPEEEDAEILTDTSTARAPGRWPDDPVGEPWKPDIEEEDSTDTERERGRADREGNGEPSDEGGDEEPEAVGSVPSGPIGCPECGFAADPESSYRDGDSCPECGAWLRVERNR